MDSAARPRQFEQPQLNSLTTARVSALPRRDGPRSYYRLTVQYGWALGPGKYVNWGGIGDWRRAEEAAEAVCRAAGGGTIRF